MRRVHASFDELKQPHRRDSCNARVCVKRCAVLQKAAQSRILEVYVRRVTLQRVEPQSQDKASQSLDFPANTRALLPSQYHKSFALPTSV